MTIEQATTEVTEPIESAEDYRRRVAEDQGLFNTYMGAASVEGNWPDVTLPPEGVSVPIPVEPVTAATLSAKEKLSALLQSNRAQRLGVSPAALQRKREEPSTTLWARTHER